jgi:hypothetical protein
LEYARDASDTTTYTLPSGISNGMTIRNTTGGAMYYIELNQKRLFDGDTYVSWGQPAWKDFSNDIVSSIPNGPNMVMKLSDSAVYINPLPAGLTNGMNIRDVSNGAIFHIQSDKRRWYDWNSYVSWGQPAYIDVSKETANLIPLGYNMNIKITNGMTVHDNSDGAVYTIENGLRRWYPNGSIYASWGSPPYRRYAHMDIVYVPRGPDYAMRY